MDTIEMADGTPIPRLILGGWQTRAGDGETALAHLLGCAEAGMRAFETADAYPGHEALLGRFRAAWAARGGDPEALRFHTRYNPDLSDGRPSAKQVTAAIDRALEELGVDRLDLLQLQWWRFDVPGWSQTLEQMAKLAAEGKIDRIGVTNFGPDTLAPLLEVGLPIASNQVQYSLIDTRPEKSLAALCQRHSVVLFAYGPLAGGFLTERWLGRPDPGPGGEGDDFSREYRFMIEAFGGWALHQGLLGVLDEIARRRGFSIVQVALRWLLDRPGLSAALVGASSSSRIGDLLRVFDLILDHAEQAAIEAATARRRGPEGEVSELERDPDGPFHRLIQQSLATKAAT